MEEEGLLSGGRHSGLAVVLKGESSKEGSQRSRLVSFCNDFGDQSVERTLEHIFGLPYKTISPLTQKIDPRVISSILENGDYQFQKDTKNVATSNRDGLLIIPDHSGPPIVGIDESSISGLIKIIKPPLILESHALFSSARANSCVWKGKWMYEATLETAGIQQIGWASLSCPFTEHKGVGDSSDSYAYDGKRVTKWNKDAEPYGQAWVVGDVIGCCIDLDSDEIIFYRNGVSLGVAFSGIRKIAPGLGYFPALSLSHGESCELNFGAYPFRYPIKDYLPIVVPPSVTPFVNNLLSCFSRLIEMQRDNRAEVHSVEKLRMLKRFVSFQEIFHPVTQGIGKALFSLMDLESSLAEYISWGPLLSFFIQVFKVRPPHDFKSLDRVLDCFLEFQESRPLFLHIINALSSGCKVSPFVLSECPHSGSYTHLALAVHILRREELMILWWRSSNFELSLEGFLSRKNPNSQDLLGLLPFVCWPGSNEDSSNENNMVLTTTALSEAVKKVEEKQRELCCLIMQFIPPTDPPQLPGSVFRTFLQNVLLKNRGADRNLPPPGVSKNSVIVSLFSAILHFLSEGFAFSDVSKLLMSCGSEVGFLHRGGQQAFPMSLFLKNDPHRVDIPRIGGSFDHLTSSHPVHDEQEDEVINWEEGCMDDEQVKVTHSGRQKPCCCSSYDSEYTTTFKDPIRYVAKSSRANCSSVPESSVHVNAECSTGNLTDEITEKPSTSDQTTSDYSFRSVHQTRTVLGQINLTSTTLKEEELLDAMLLLYHLGISPNLKQASSYSYRQSQSIALLEETDRQIRERLFGAQVTHLKEARSTYREEVMDCIRHSAWYRVSLFSRWKQRGMYATCMYIVQLLLILSKEDLMFAYIPEYYLETLVNCFHVLRKSDPPFVPTSLFLRQGLTSFVTFVVTHFNDPRIESAELKDLLLQSISVLVEYKEYLAVFECNKAATSRLPKALLEAFDDRSWILVTNVMLRLCKGYGFCSSKHGGSSSISIVFQILLREACINDTELFSSFLNRLFNKLSWAMTEFSVSIREMQEYYKALEFQQRKCSYIYDISCNLARVLEFCTGEIPQAFLSGADTNLRRLTEIIVFILNHLNSAGDPEFFDLSIKRPGQAFEKIHRGMILSPLAGIMTNLLDASKVGDEKQHIDIVEIFASMDCPASVLNGFQYILDYDWGSSFTNDDYLGKIRQLENFSSMLVCRTASWELESPRDSGESASEDTICYICYACEADAQFVPCSHRSCFGCISRHLLNCQRCFFCNATVTDIVPADGSPA